MFPEVGARLALPARQPAILMWARWVTFLVYPCLRALAPKGYLVVRSLKDHGSKRRDRCARVNRFKPSRGGSCNRASGTHKQRHGDDYIAHVEGQRHDKSHVVATGSRKYIAGEKPTQRHSENREQ
jgi:hypothetical protein